MSTGRIDAIGVNDKPMKGLANIDTNKKVKKFDAELAGQLSGSTNYVAYMPNIGNLLNGKGAGQAATQV